MAPGKQHEALDAAFGLGGDPADLLGHEGAEAAHLAQQLAALHGVDETVARSTLGAAGLSRERPRVMSRTAASPAAP